MCSYHETVLLKNPVPKGCLLSSFCEASSIFPPFLPIGYIFESFLIKTSAISTYKKTPFQMRGVLKTAIQF